MKTINYPLIYFELKEDAVLGILVGTDYKVVNKDIRTVKSALQSHIQKQYKKLGEYDEVGIETAKFKTIDIKIRPRYREHKGSYAGGNDVKITVSIVFGDTGNGQYICYLPLLDDYFYYDDPRQLRTLVNYFASDYYNRLSPEEIFRHAQFPDAKLDSLSLRVKESYTRDWSNFEFEYKYEVLTKLAEEYPFPKTVRRNQSPFPDAAWELENKVVEVANNIFKVSTNVLVTGKHGVGKSAVLKAAIRKITNQAKKNKIDISFWRIRAQRITASSKYLGEWQKAFEELISELEEADGILWVEDVIQLLKTGGSSPENSVAAFMINFLQEKDFQMVGEVTNQELESIRRFLPGFVECFQIINIEELQETQVQNVLNQFADYCGKNLKIKIPQDSISLAYRLLLRYYPYESFPGKAVRFFQQCIHTAQLEERNVVNPMDVIDNFTTQTGLPELFLRDDILLNKKDLEGFFKSKIIGQPDAISNLVDIVTVFKAGLNNPKKPISTMLFAGPTGVGKTQSAKALASYFFGKGQKKYPLVRIDMSEFQHPSQITQLIGVGNNVGKLVQDIREKPFAVLLLDEVEKAHRSIFDALLTVLDEGILVDAFGRETNFRNTIVIMTTNLGASNRRSISFEDTTSEEDRYMSAISGFFRPEFVNRIDSIVMFNSLTAKDIEAITLLELEELKKREGFVKKKLTLHFSKQLVSYLASAGFDEKYGARPLQRAIEHEVITPMAAWLLKNAKVKNAILEIGYNKSLKVKVKKTK